MVIITAKILKQIAPHANDKIINDLEKYLDEGLAKYKVNTYLRICHFLAQAAHESDSFKVLEEYASGSHYEGRKDLGNNKPGDGIKYKGRGIFQLTGKSNYTEYGKLIGIDLLNDPKAASDPKNSVSTALEYWNKHGLSALADKGDIETITRRINGGLNGYTDRQLCLKRALLIIPKDISLSTVIISSPQEIVPKVVESTDPFNQVLLRKGDKSTTVRVMQHALVDKGYRLVVDGDFGPGTEAALKKFQIENGLEVTGVFDANTSYKLF